MYTPFEKRLLKVVFTSFALLVLVLLGASWIARYTAKSEAGVPTGVRATVAIENPSLKISGKPKTRLNYSLSVIPGGVLTAEELRMKIGMDPILSGVFKGCDLSELKESELPKDSVVFITFRRGNKIKWNRRPLVVHAHEHIITGCGKTVLMRCGNEISWTPQEPSESLDPGTLENPTNAVAQPPITVPVPGPVPFKPNADPVLTASTFSAPFFAGPGGFTAPSPQVSVPEPSSGELLAGSLVFSSSLYILSLGFKRRKS